MVKIIKKYIPTFYRSLRPAYSMNPEYITIHNTANASKGANAEMHSRYLLNGGGGRGASWHFTVDDKEIYQHLPTNENGWHAGDGANGSGNRKSIGIEICENADGDFEKAVANAQWLVRKLLDDHDLSIDRVVPHKHWSGKNCPRKLLSRFDDFKDGVFKSASKETQVKSATTESVSVSTVSTSDKGKRVESIYRGSEGINFYKEPSFDNPVGSFSYGMGWTIRKKIKVGKSEMYEVENSKGAVYYITAREDLVKVADNKPNFTVPTVNLVYGSKGKQVGYLQEILKYYGFYKGALDNSYGPLMVAAVKAFQRDRGILVDGKAGPQTRKEISKVA
ncbi:peptidoglycan recognition protein family protein [Sediminibacillus massiliensis]|uniref:peptidoglycan recognition protein family protein n=1 Tax=Sediminibacillus massiliensis TaxID=1926277 RepID=UPI0009885B9A|nr:N-acetylmuramoyl-L-alanine amidase [Sediminibacillus massiliensis]